VQDLDEPRLAVRTKIMQAIRMLLKIEDDPEPYESPA
jgi:hypothetical protein